MKSVETETLQPKPGVFQDRILNSLVMGHFIVDVLNGQRTIVLTYLSLFLGLSNYGLGIITTIYVVSSALAQPIFGYVSDRVGARWVAAGGILLMGVFFSLAMFFPGWPAVILLVLASICSGAFHPAGATEATLAGRERMQGREATASSLFFLFGQMGFGIGPMIGGPLLSNLGMPGFLILSIFTIPIGLFAASELKSLIKPMNKPKPVEKPVKSTSPKLVISKSLLLMIGISAFQSWSQSNITAYMPRYLADMQLTPSVYGVIIGLFTAGSAIGCMVGGELADRTSRKTVITWSLLSSTIPLLLIAFTGLSYWLYPLMFIAGGLTGGSFSVIVVQAQKVIPGGMGLASGLILGFIFSAGAIGTMFTGKIADVWGYQPVFYFTALIALLGGILGLMLKEERAG
ncbi:arabinose efflux permease [Leptolinea tardivitalis]|nr:arabinose efflux permease [Leptolinea tardivitalis]